MKTALTIVGVAFILIGLLWLMQGMGIVRWPEVSFMVDQRPWALRGAALAVAGLIALRVARRRRR